MVRAAQEEGSVRSDVDASIATRLLFGMVNSLVEWYRPEGTHDPVSVADAVTSIAFDGLSRRDHHPGAR